MRNLIRVNFLRWKNRLSTVFCLIGIVCCSVINCVTVYREQNIGTITFDPTYYPILMIAALLMTDAAVLLNRGEGEPVRNAVIAGYSKTQILLAELPPALLFACIASLIMLLPMLRVPSVLIRFPAAYILLGALGILLMFCTSAVLTVILSMNLNNRIVAIIFSAVCLLGGIIAAKPLCQSLMEPKETPNIRSIWDEKKQKPVEIVTTMQNPEYISPPARTSVTTLCLLLPQSSVSLTEIYLDTSINPTGKYTLPEQNRYTWTRENCESMLKMLPLSELGMMLLITALGLLLFKRSDMT